MSLELERLNQEWFAAWLEKDVAVVQRLMSPEYIYIAPNGQILDRETILNIIRSPSYRLHRGTCTEVRVTSLGSEAAALVKHYQGAGTFNGKPFTDDQRCTMVFVRHKDGWMIALEQCSAISQ